jgi:hypothetical protein
MKTQLLITPILALLAMGCNPEIEHACTDIGIASVQLTVEDAEGLAIPDATATYNLVGETPQDCEGWDDGTFSCGFELQGTIELHVEAAGYTSADQTVVVAADECHVLTEVVTVTLIETECTLEALPSAIITLTDIDTTDPINVATVEYDFGDGFEECSGDDASNEWTCGDELTGDMVLRIDADGYPLYEETHVVELDADGCHPMTALLDLELDAD